jgi:hypothetical protein
VLQVAQVDLGARREGPDVIDLVVLRPRRNDRVQLVAAVDQVLQLGERSPEDDGAPVFVLDAAAAAAHRVDQQGV